MGAVGGAGAAIGVLAGGVLTQFADWRMIFYVNVPVAALLFVAALHIIPPDAKAPRWRGLDIPGALLATTSIAAIVFAITQADSVGWTSFQTHLCGLGGLAGLGAFAIYELHIDTPLLRVEADRRPCRRRRPRAHARSRRLDLRVLPALLALPPERAWHGIARDGARVHPTRCAAGMGTRREPPHRQARRARPATGAFAVAAVGMLVLSRVGENGSYLRDVLPGMLIAGIGWRSPWFPSPSQSLTGTREAETGMLSGLTRPDTRSAGRSGIAILSTIAAGSGAMVGPHAASGIADAFLVAALVATLAGMTALVVLPRARHFLPKLHLSPHAMPIH